MEKEIKELNEEFLNMANNNTEGESIPVGHVTTDNPTFTQTDIYNSDEPIDMYPEITPDKPKGSKKIWKVLAVVIPIVLVLLGIGGYFLYNYLEFKKPITPSWGQQYYKYLSNNPTKQKSQMMFYEVDSIENPVMVLTYKADDQTVSDIYYIENRSVKKIDYKKPVTVEFLYNISEQNYDYYAHLNEETKNTYQKLSAKILNSNSTAVFVFNEGDVDTVTDLEGRNLAVSNFEKTFIESDVQNKGITLKQNLKAKELKQTIMQAIANYKTQKQLITNALKGSIADKLEALKTKQEQLANAKKAVEQQQTEEAKKKAEENAKKGLQAGDFYLQYGKYKSDVAQYEITGGLYTLNQDGTFVYENDWKDVSGEIHHTKRNGTYSVKFYEGTQQDPAKGWIITFTTKSSNEENPIQTETYDVKENNKFTARQYKNNCIYTK